MTAPLLRFARYREIAADVAARAENVIVASSGMAAAITTEALRNSERGAVSLHLPTIEVFARTIVNDAGEYPRIASEIEQRLAMRSAARLVADVIVDAPGLANMLHRSYRDVRDSGLTIDTFEARVRSASVRNRRRIEAMIRAWREYERLIAHVGAVDAADVLARAAELIAPSLSPQIVAGFYDMTGAQLRIVHALANVGKLAAIYIPSDAPFANCFVRQLPESLPSPHSSLLRLKAPSSESLQYETKFDELREVCHSVKTLLDSGAKSIAITARSFAAHDIHLINRFASELGFTTTAAETIPLRAQRIGRATRTLLQLRQSAFRRFDVIEVLRDGFRMSKQISIDALDDATRRANIACGDSDSLRSRASEYADVVAELESLTTATPLSGAAWATLIERILDRFSIETDSDVAAHDAMQNIATTLRRAESWRRRFDVDAVIDLIDHSEWRTAALGRPHVWVGDVMRFRGRTFDHVFVVRMEEDLFPQRRSEDPLLPDRDRRALGLREIGDGKDEEQLLLQLLHDSAETSLHFSVASNDGLGKLIRASIWSAPAMPALSSPRAAARPPHSRQLQLIARSGTRSEFDGYVRVDTQIEARLRAALQSLSPTQLEDFGECPQKFLLKHVLGVRELDEPERELHINVRDKGSLDHRILERFYRTVDAREIEEAAASLPQVARPLRERLDSIIDEAFDELPAPYNAAMREIERRATKRHLHAFVAADLAEMIATAFRPREFEYAFGPKFVKRGKAARPEPFIFRVGDLEIAIEGQIDRVDGDGVRLHIIDYKSGQALRHKDLAEKIDRGVRMQLALYAIAATEFFGVDESNVSAAIKPLRGGNGAKYRFALSDHTERLRETIALFVGAILRGEFPAFPNGGDDIGSCKYCPVSHSCRTLHNDSERYAVTRAGDARTLLAP